MSEFAIDVPLRTRERDIAEALVAKPWDRMSPDPPLSLLAANAAGPTVDLPADRYSVRQLHGEDDDLAQDVEHELDGVDLVLPRFELDVYCADRFQREDLSS